jgi:hypothetical protein
VLRPWWVQDALIAAILACIPTGFGFFKWIAGDEMKKKCKAAVVQPRTRRLGLVLLSIEAIVTVALFTTQPRLVRIIPGHFLDRRLAWPGQILRLGVHGKIYELASPQKTSFYAGCGADCVRYYLDRESKETRAQILSTVLNSWNDGQTREKSDVDDLTRSWFGAPAIMTRSGVATHDFTGTLVTIHAPPIQFQLSKINGVSRDGVETYVAEAQ